MTDSPRVSQLQNAMRLQRAGKLAEAAQIYVQILGMNPQDFDALHALGVIHYQRGQLDEAERLIAEATRVNPGSADAHYNRACLLQKLKRPQDALACFDRALAIKPGYVEALTNRGNLLMELKRHEDALDCFNKALAIKPDLVPVLLNLGNAFLSLARFEEALRCYDKILSLEPRIADAWNRRGETLAALARYADSLSSHEKALSINPNDIRALASRAMLLFGFKRYEEAAAAFELLLKADPTRSYAAGNLFQCRLYCCDWRSYEEQRNALVSDLRLGKRTVHPMVGTMFCQSADEQLQCSRIWIAAEFPAATPIWQGELYRHGKIRLAYLAPELGGNAVATQLAGVFEHHDKTRFETTLVSFGHDESSAMRARLLPAFDRILDVRGMDDAEAASQMRAMEIDIAVDLAGLTGNCRTGILARRPVPIQANYLGFPATMGADYIDYILADRHVIPTGHFGSYSEKIVHLPDSYLPNDRTRRIAARAPTRREAGLPETGFVFCSFNNSFKILPGMFDVWMRLLQAIEGSVLWLPQVNSAALANLRSNAQARGVGSERLVFAPFAAAEEDHLARLRLADLFLDTIPYNAHSTACDALWAGLPVLTCMGNTFAGRVAASLLHAVGLPELIVDSLGSYEALAVKLARDTGALSAIKEKLARNRNTCPLFDTQRFTRHLEAAYSAMWERHERGVSPANFAVEPIATPGLG